MTKRYVIVGAGAIGGGLGGLLIEARVPTILVARGAHFDAMSSNGLTIHTPERSFTVQPDLAVGPDSIRLGIDDVLVIATKTQQAEAALAEWADCPVHDGDTLVGTAGDRLPVLMALNGVASEQLALRWFARVYGICVWMPATFLEPGDVTVRTSETYALLHTSRVPAALTDDDDRALLAEVRTDWARAGVDVPLPADVMPWKYRKLLANLANSVNALIDDIEGVSDLIDQARTEAIEAYTTAGIVMNTEAEEESSRQALRIGKVPGQPGGVRSSTWQSMARATGSSESDYLNGEIVAIAHQHGRTAPVNSAIASLMREAVRTGAKPGDLTEADLRARIDPGRS
ncbi:MAG: 2-dehydropantoate 2-reductase N-terminal domain-containing protein [Antricoccus sp.]